VNLTLIGMALLLAFFGSPFELVLKRVP